MKTNPLIIQALIKLLKGKRLALSLSQSELADRLDAQQSFVSKYEGGERNLTFDEVWEILNAMNANLEDFISEFNTEVKSLYESKGRVQE